MWSSNVAEETSQPQPVATRSGARLASLLSIVLWVVGLGLAFVVPPKSPYIWVPDALLLAGFWPLLYIWRPGWPWLVFGLMNVGIGMILLIASFVKDEDFPSQQLVPMNHHLRDYHAPFTWMYIGLFSIAFGLVRMARHFIAWILERKKRREEK